MFLWSWWQSRFFGFPVSASGRLRSAFAHRIIELFEGRRAALGSPNSQVGQGQLGDCYFLSAVAATGSTNMDEGWPASRDLEPFGIS